jgi:hypothetical protein
VFAISAVHWHAGCCLQKKHVTWQLLSVAVTSLHLRGSVFTEPLLRNGLHNPDILLLHVGPCLRSRCLAMRWSNPLQYNSVFLSWDSLTSVCEFGLASWMLLLPHLRDLVAPQYQMNSKNYAVLDSSNSARSMDAGPCPHLFVSCCAIGSLMGQPHSSFYQISVLIFLTSNANCDLEKVREPNKRSQKETLFSNTCSVPSDRDTSFQIHVKLQSTP